MGLNILVKARVDMGQQRNLVIVSTTLVFGIGGMVLGSLEGLSLCGLVAIVLNLVLPKADETEDLHEEEEIVDGLVK